MTLIPTQSGYMRLEDSKNSCGRSSQTIPAWNRAIPAPRLEPTDPGSADRSN